MKVFLPSDPTTHVAWATNSILWPMKNEEAARSKIQYQIGQLIKQKFPFDAILEDITLPNNRCSLDFFLPTRRIAIEVQGSQHDTFNAFFHSTNKDFLEQKNRDEFKALFCQLNNIKLIYVRNQQDLYARLS